MPCSNCSNCSNSNSYSSFNCSPCKSNTSYNCYSCYKPCPVNKRQCTDLAINIQAFNLFPNLILYLILVANNGPITAQNVFINGTFSGSLLFILPPSAQPGIISVNIGDIPPGPFSAYVGIVFIRSESSFVSATVSANTPDCYLPNNSAEASDIINGFSSISSSPPSDVEQNELLQLAGENFPTFLQFIRDRYPELNLINIS